MAVRRVLLGVAFMAMATRGWADAAAPGGSSAGPENRPNPIQHVVIIVQENRSFDHYFGAFPGANGIPAGTCIPYDPSNPQMGCIAPFHDQHDANAGAGHGAGDAVVDADDGITTDKMDGFVYDQQHALGKAEAEATTADRRQQVENVRSGIARYDTMGYHTDAEIPNYWAYARNFVLQDQLYEGVRAWSLASHLDLVSEWVADCSNPLDVSTCNTNPVGQARGSVIRYPWVNLFELMDLNNVTWKYYLGSGEEPDCDDDEMTCDPELQQTGVPTLWNPVSGFAWVQAQGAQYIAAHNPEADQYLLDIKNGTLPQVSWIVPPRHLSEHPPSSITAGEDYVTSLVNAVMQSPYWYNTVIFITWDDWGGFYDHMAPPNVDMNPTRYPIQGFGFRVPGLMISAYAKAGFVDHRLFDTDSYATFIENIFMHKTRLDPVALGEPDSRPDIRDALTSVSFLNGTTQDVGDFADEFDLSKPPRPPLVLSPYIPSDIHLKCGSTTNGSPQDCTQTHVYVEWLAVTGPYIPGPFTYQVLRDGVPVTDCSPTKTRCDDKKVPPGVHYYQVYSIDPNGVASPASAGAEADVPAN